MQISPELNGTEHATQKLCFPIPGLGWEGSASESLPPPVGTLSTLLFTTASSSVLSVAMVRWMFWYLDTFIGRNNKLQLTEELSVAFYLKNQHCF